MNTTGMLNAALEEMLVIHTETCQKLEELAIKYNLEPKQYCQACFSLWRENDREIELLKRLKKEEKSKND